MNIDIRNMTDAEIKKKTDDEIARLRGLGITGEWNEFGAKWALKVKLTNGRFLFICPLMRTIRHGIKGSVKYRNPYKWCEMRGLEIAE